MSASERKDAGFNVKQLKAVGWNAVELLAAGFSSSEVRSAYAKHCKAAGFGASELRGTARDAKAWQTTAVGKLTDKVLKAVAVSCPRLASLDVSECRNLADVAMVAAAASCPSLASLTVCWCGKLTDEVLVLKLQGWVAAHCRAQRRTLQGPTPHTARFSIKVLGRTLQGTSPHTAGPGLWLPNK